MKILLTIVTLAFIVSTAHATVSNEARDILVKPWGVTSLNKGMLLLDDHSESVQSRKLILEILQSKRKVINPGDLAQLLEKTILIASDPAEHPVLSSTAIRAMSNLMLTMEESSQISRPYIKQKASFLVDISRDYNRDINLRGAAIRATGNLGIVEAKGLLRRLLSDQAENSRPEIARNALLSMWQLEGVGATDLIATILSSTNDPDIFGTAAFTLGKINTPESMVNLIQNINRFPESGSCDAVLVDMEDTILGVLEDKQNKNHIHAIEATKYLWRQGQRDRYIPLIRGLLTATPVETRMAALDRLINAAGELEFEHEKRELVMILQIIADEPDMSVYADRIQRRLSSRLLVPSDQGGPIPVVPKKE